MLGNHDTVLMVPAMEAMGIRMLLNEAVVIDRGGQHLHLAGIDDAHYYRVDNIEKAASDIPHDEFSILLSHTPEIYRQAAHADFQVLAERAHPRRTDMPSGFDSGDTRCPASQAVGSGSVEVSRDGWLHIGWRRLVDRPGAVQFPP